MKKLLSLAILSLLMSIFFFNCSESNDDLNSKEISQNEIIFEQSSNKTAISPNYYDNHFSLIKKIGNNSEKTELIKVLKNNGFDLSVIDNEQIKKFYFDNSEILMYSITVKNSQNKIIIYKYEDLFQVNKVEYYSNGDKMQFNLRTLDNNLFYSLQIDDNNKFGNVLVKNNEKINSFSNDVYNLFLSRTDPNAGGGVDGGSEAECCRKEASWTDCMSCTVDDCASNWACAITFGLIPLEMAAGFAVSCIGAGPNTFC